MPEWLLSKGGHLDRLSLDSNLKNLMVCPEYPSECSALFNARLRPDHDRHLREGHHTEFVPTDSERKYYANIGLKERKIFEGSVLISIMRLLLHAVSGLVAPQLFQEVPVILSPLRLPISPPGL
jgi:hypothetical protein